MRDFHEIGDMEVERRGHGVEPMLAGKVIGHRAGRLYRFDPERNDHDTTLDSAPDLAGYMIGLVRFPGKDDHHQTAGSDRLHDRSSKELARDGISWRHPAADSCLLQSRHDGVRYRLIVAGVADEHVVSRLAPAPAPILARPGRLARSVFGCLHHPSPLGLPSAPASALPLEWPV